MDFAPRERLGTFLIIVSFWYMINLKIFDTLHPVLAIPGSMIFITGLWLLLTPQAPITRMDTYVPTEAPAQVATQPATGLATGPVTEPTQKPAKKSGSKTVKKTPKSIKGTRLSEK